MRIFTLSLCFLSILLCFAYARKPQVVGDLPTKNRRLCSSHNHDRQFSRTLIQEYQKELSDCRQRIDNLIRQGKALDRDLDQIRAALKVKEKIVFPKGKVFLLDNRWLQEELKAIGKISSQKTRLEKLKIIQDKLSVLLRELKNLNERRLYSARQIKAMLQDILAADEFRTREKVPWLEKIARRFLEFLYQLFSALGISDGAALGWFVFVFCSAIVLGLIFYLLYSIRRVSASRVVSPTTFVTQSKRKTPEELKALAYSQAQKGNFKEAIRNLYIALLLVLDKSGLVNYDESKTNWEYLPALPKNKPIHQLFLSFTVLFDRKCYGLEPCSAADFSFCTDLFNQAETTAL